MIKNETQYRRTKVWVTKFEDALAEFRSTPHPNMDSGMVKLHEDALINFLSELREDVEEYEKMRSGKPMVVVADSFQALAQGLIRARISRGLTHKQLAKLLNVSEQQVQQDEACEYASANVMRLEKIAQAMDVTLKARLSTSASPKGPPVKKASRAPRGTRKSSKALA